MTDSHNPYAAPQTLTSQSPGAAWLQGGSMALEKTQWGLSLVYYGIVIALLCGLALGGGAVAVGMNQMWGAIVLAGAGLGILLAALLMFIGPLLCLSVPAESRAGGFLRASVLLQFVNLTHSIVQAVAPTVVPSEIKVVVQLLGIIGFISFVLFLKRLAHYIGKDDYARRAVNILIGLGLLFVIGVGLGMAAVLRSDSLLMFLGISVILGMIIIFLMYANLLNDLRKAIAAHL